MYDRGLLFVLIHGRVRIYDASSGTFYRDLLLQEFSFKSEIKWQGSSVFLVSVNSKYVAILYHSIAKSGQNRWKTMLRVYELEALKNCDAEPKSLLLATIKNDPKDDILSMMMDETRIAICILSWTKSNGRTAFVLVFDFSPRQTE